MSISLDKLHAKQISSHSIVQIAAIDNNSLLALDQEGQLWCSRDDSQFFQFSKIQGDYCVCFDFVLNKNELELIGIGTEEGTLQLLNKAGSISKEVKEAHKGSITCLKFSNDYQTIATASEDNVVKLWSRNGMLRSEIYQADSPCFSLCWSGDD